jgi:hypothetical protein
MTCGDGDGVTVGAGRSVSSLGPRLDEREVESQNPSQAVAEHRGDTDPPGASGSGLTAHTEWVEHER